MLPRGFTPIFFEELDSTNRYALERIEELEQHSVVMSEIQTAGRGRMQRNWDSSIRGNLYMTLVEKRPPPEFRLQNFTQLMAVAAVAACRQLGLHAGIKWPNDIFVEGKKVGGILSESRFSGPICLGLVIGLGLNITSPPRLHGKQDARGYEAGAINDFLPSPSGRDDLFPKILSEYYRRYSAFVKGGYASMAGEFEGLLLYTERGFYLEGVWYAFAGLTSRGELRGRKPSGSTVTIAAGEPSFLAEEELVRSSYIGT